VPLEGGPFFARRHVPQLDRLSLLPEANVLPSGLKATDHTSAVWPWRVACSLPVATSHSLIVLSALPEASVLRSGLNATEKTGIVWPRRMASSLPVATSQILAELS